MSQEKNISERASFRRSFSKTAKSIDKLLSKDERTEADIVELISLFKFLTVRHENLKEKDEIILETLQFEDSNDEKLNAEQDKIDEYYVKYLNYETKVNKIIDSAHDSNVDSESVTSTSAAKKTKYKLPKLQLKKFGGDLAEWLPFWAQFDKLHSDEEIADVDKLGYLTQCMSEGSVAKQLVESYPATGDMYDVVVKALKARFGRKDLLTEHYIRELLSLVIGNACNSSKLSIVTLYDKIQSHLRHLQTLDVTKDNCAPFLMPLVSSSLPEELLRMWERNTRSTKELSSSQDLLEDLLSFVQSEVEGLQKMQLAKKGFGVTGTAVPKSAVVKPKNVPTALGLLSEGGSQEHHVKNNGSKKGNCIFCSNSHNAQDCKKALQMTPQERYRLVGEKKACFCCLTPGHHARTCRKRPTCAVCGKSHFPIMCSQLNSSAASGEQAKERTTESGTERKALPITRQEVLANTATQASVLMQTLVVVLRNGDEQKKARLLIDSASHRSYILKNIAEEMNLVPLGCERVQHSVFGGATTGVVDHNVYQLLLTDLNATYQCTLQCLDQRKICGQITSTPEGPWLEELARYGIRLSDVATTSDIDILVGADVAAKLWTGNRVVLSSGLVAMETRLGWTLSGRVPKESRGETLISSVHSLFSEGTSVSDLWTLDTLGILDPTERQSKSDLEAATQQHFLETVKTTAEGRFEVKLPWIENHAALPDHFQMSLKRLHATVRRLKNENLYDSYHKVFMEWLEEGVIEEVPKDQVDFTQHYLPHRHVVKEGSTTPVRPVFDASAKDLHGPSLNQCLDKGPNLLEKIPAILSRFRLKRIGVIGDIRRAFLQIVIDNRDRDFLRFLWIEKDGTLKFYRHCRVVFGVSPSPFLLESCIALHLKETLSKPDAKWHPELIRMLEGSFYVDNCMISLENQEKAMQFVKMATEVMMRRKFELRGWEVSFTESEDSKPINVLGYVWDKYEDTLSINVEKVLDMSAKVTKRSILSAAHKVFDPLGFACSVTLVPKILLQETWEKKTPWDEELEEDMKGKFLNWIAEIPLLAEMKVPRWVSHSNTPGENWSIHVFADACKTSYAAAIFLRVDLKDGVHVQLLSARSKVAPIARSKRMTIPRLELLAASIAARLYVSVKKDYGLDDVSTVFWTDATTVLAWIRRDEQWDVFVMNRVREIRQLSSGSEWRHVPGVLNPADLPSRGCTVKKLIETRWWEGPFWLKTEPECWPKSTISYNEEEIVAEKRKTISSTCCDIQNERSFYSYFSQYKKLVRMIGWIFRFKNNTTTVKRRGELTSEEFKFAERRLLILVQNDVFSGIDDLKLKTLLPFLDQDGMIRLTTKVSHRKDDTQDFCHPIVLPTSDHPVVRRLILDVHREQCHAGTQMLLSILRQRYWILGGRRTVRKVLKTCVKCKRYEAKKIEIDPCPLPAARVGDAKIFNVIGVDLTGPLFLKTDNSSSKKVWICLFTCAVYRAVRLELVSSLSTDSFIQAFRRFCSRQGRPSIVYSDQGTNFVGFNNASQKLDWNEIARYSSARRIEWRFNPPSAPWWGGWWERLIGLLKKLLKRVLGRTTVNYEELQTILSDCESVINSRPLTYLSEDASELAALTPNMFLHDLDEEGMPESELIVAKDLRKRFRYRNKLKEDLRTRFRNEYLGQLKIFSKGRAHPDLKLGEMVLIGDDGAKRLQWPLGQIVELIPGVDGVVRVVRVRSATGILVRPIQRICRLEFE